MQYPYCSLPITKKDREDYGSTRLKWFLYGMLSGVTAMGLVYYFCPRVETQVEIREQTKIVEVTKYVPTPEARKWADAFATPDWCKHDPDQFCIDRGFLPDNVGRE